MDINYLFILLNYRNNISKDIPLILGTTGTTTRICFIFIKFIVFIIFSKIKNENKWRRKGRTRPTIDYQLLESLFQKTINKEG